MKAFKLSLTGLCVIAACQATMADTIAQSNNSQISTQAETSQSLETITVSGEVDNNILEKKVGETQKSAKTLSRQQVQDSRDLVRYETGVTVVETGRTGSSGYAVRGVDENRVGIMVDGLRQAETLSSQGFKELFEGYGNFNNTRNSIEMENVKLATITKGADSIKSGSGALGGSVMFDTKDARDYLLDKDYYVGIKRGYQSMNRQDLNSITLAGRYKWFDVLVVNTRRDGHEMKNYFYDIYKTSEEDQAAVGKTREKTDPYKITRRSTLVKFGFQPNENHRLSIALDDSKLRTKGEDLSYTLRVNESGLTKEKLGQRLADDKSQRKNIQLAYENFNQTPLWDHLKISYSSQKITNNARTDEYCYNANCVQVSNPQGLHLDDSNGVYKVVDQYGGEITGKGVPPTGWAYGTQTEYRNSKDEVISDLDYREPGVQTISIDCSKLDCSKKYRVFVKQNENYEDVYGFEDRDITVKTLDNGQKYGEITRKSVTSEYGWKQEEEAYFLLPLSKGYSRDDYNDRDLNTNTKQINLDLDKEFNLGNTKHSLKYGALYSKTDKSMVNKDGYVGGNVQWWANDFFCNELVDWVYTPNPALYPETSCTGAFRSNIGNYYSYLIPVTTKNTAIHLGDNIRLTNWLGLDLNYRFDKVKHQPGYDNNVPVPKGLLAGVLVPLPADAVVYGIYANCGYNSDCMNNNVAQNLARLLQEKTYKHHSYNIGLNLDPIDWVRLQFKYSNGFRAPTSDEIYMTFKHPNFSIGPNTQLKAETAKTKEVALTLYKNQSFITLSAFRTDYDNFIDLVFQRNKPVEEGSALEYPFYQNQNRDYAKVTGFEVATMLNFGDITDKLNGLRFGYKLTYQKGRISDGIPMNAIQPTTAIYNLGYSTEDDKFGIDLFVTDVAAKKRQDTYNMYWEAQAKDPDKLVQGMPVTDSGVAWRSGHYTLWDTIFYVKPIKNLTLTAGLYNITNRKYITWDSARSIRAFGTINQIDQNTGAGIKRFYAPGRNFRLTAELTF